MPAPHMNCLCERWAWRWVKTYERANGVLVDTWRCQSCGSTVTRAYDPPSEDAIASGEWDDALQAVRAREGGSGSGNPDLHEISGGRQ